MRSSITTRWLLSSCMALLPMYSYAIEMSLQQAESLALQNDAVLQAKLAQTEAFREQAVAADTLPDPKLKLGLANFPTDTFARDQEAMTQIQVGVQQMIPRGDTLNLKSQQALQSGEASFAEVQDRRQLVTAQVRSAYLELLYWLKAEEVVRNSYQLFEQLTSITQSQYQSGLQKQQDVIRAELELGLLADKLDDIRANQKTSYAQFAKLIGVQDENVVITRLIPKLHDMNITNDPLTILREHPKVFAENAKVARSQYGIELARQEYKPEWMIDVTYGFRDGYNPNGTERADFLSAMVVFDMPLFTGNRQDRNISASRLQHQAALQSREDLVRELKRQYEEQMANYQAMQGRLHRYEKLLVPQAHENADAALHAYQNRRGEFTALMRARITELETELSYLRLRINFLKTQAMLLYLVGEHI